MKLNSFFRKTKNHNFKRNPTEIIDFRIFIVIGLLIAIGLLSIYSATFDAGTSVFFYKQLSFVAIGFVIMIAVIFIPEKWIKSYSLAFYIFSIALLVGVLIFGKTVSGTRGWFQFAGISFQPSEFAKITTLLLVSQLLSKKGNNIHNLRDLIKVVIIFVFPIALIVLQPDMGSASVLMFLLLAVLFWVGFDLSLIYFILFTPLIIIISLIGFEYYIIAWVFFTITYLFFKKGIIRSLSLIAFIFVIGYFSQNILRLLPNNTQNRIETFINPQKDPLNKGYNVMQSILAVGSGGLYGKGYLKGSQTQLRYIPEQRTDFVFCVPAEEFGFIGGTFVVILFSIFFWRTLKIATGTEDIFYSILAFGIGSIFLYHSIINIGMVIRLVPVMGIPLPFMSYGGTALIMNMAMVGLIMNAYRSRKEKVGF